MRSPQILNTMKPLFLGYYRLEENELFMRVSFDSWNLDLRLRLLRE